jgi:hypothetical protein
MKTSRLRASTTQPERKLVGQPGGHQTSSGVDAARRESRHGRSAARVDSIRLRESRQNALAARERYRVEQDRGRGIRLPEILSWNGVLDAQAIENLVGEDSSERGPRAGLDDGRECGKAIAVVAKLAPGHAVES